MASTKNAAVGFIFITLLIDVIGFGIIARPDNKSLLLPLTPSWLITGIPTLWTAGLLKD